MSKVSTNIDRRTASKILGVSIRTIDRYIRCGKLPAQQENGRIWLSKNDIANVKISESVRIPVAVVRPRRPVAVRPVVSQQVQSADNNFYRDLYEETKKTLHDYQQKLTQANYRIGQLESQPVHVPTPATQPKIVERINLSEEKNPNEELIKNIADREKELFMLKEALRREKANRVIFAIITYSLLILQPVFWFLLK